MKLCTDRVIVTEGRYDKSKLADIVDAAILTTSGFGIYKDSELKALLQKLAVSRGLIILTDSDAAGFRIRAYIKNIVPPGTCADVYLPDIYGKEKRKARPSAEGKLGVEGTDADIIRAAFARAGLPDGNEPHTGRKITTADLYEAGLTGGRDSAARRRRFLTQMDLPARLSGNSLLDVLNALFTCDEFRERIHALDE